PPTDAQRFSANWKALQEMLKVNQPEKKQTFLPKYQNGPPPNIKNSRTDPGQKDVGNKVKDKKVPPDVGPRDSRMNLKVLGVPENKHSAAPKRKKDSGQSNGVAAKKMKKTVVENRTPTEDDLWFDDVDPDDIEAAIGAEAAEMMRKKQGIKKNDKNPETALVKEKAFDGLTKVVAIDCEMVGVGPDGEDSILARVSLVNQFGKCIYDKYVKPTERVTDFRTAVSGIRPQDIKSGEEVKTVQREVADILKGRTVVGHAIHNDLKILLLDHPKKKIRDTQKYKPFRKAVQSSRPSLKVLCREILNVKVQEGEHSSVQDAQATMRLYTMVKKQWEAEIKGRKPVCNPNICCSDN
uniref:RNA exonuclease 4 n=1 Tax=Tetraodon nigroviridis TaxID=99883 RepID=H3CK19_TETNG